MLIRAKNPVKPRLLNQLRDRIRTKHCALSTEKIYSHWVHEMGAVELSAFLTYLAVERKVSASTHNQALSALLFLYLDVLHVDLRWPNEIRRPQTPRWLSKALTADHNLPISFLMKRPLYGV